VTPRSAIRTVETERQDGPTPRSVPARPPEHGAWPAEMRAETAAAFFDYRTTGEFFKGIQRGEAPRPSAYRLRAKRREPVWALDLCRNHIARRHEISNDAASGREDIGRLI
jgi:hypothetical protein